jgi:hypothetical protein
MKHEFSISSFLQTDNSSNQRATRFPGPRHATPPGPRRHGRAVARGGATSASPPNPSSPVLSARSTVRGVAVMHRWRGVAVADRLAAACVLSSSKERWILGPCHDVLTGRPPVNAKGFNVERRPVIAAGLDWMGSSSTRLELTMCAWGPATATPAYRTCAVEHFCFWAVRGTGASVGLSLAIGHCQVGYGRASSCQQ